MIKNNVALIGSILPALIITWYCSHLMDEQWEDYRVLQEQLFECEGVNDGTP